MARSENTSRNSDTDVVREMLDRVIDVQFYDDNDMLASVNIHVSDLSFGSAMWLLAEFVDCVVRRVEDKTLVPYDRLQAIFSGHRSATIRAWKKEQDALPPLEELVDVPF